MNHQVERVFVRGRNNGNLSVGSVENEKSDEEQHNPLQGVSFESTGGRESPNDALVSSNSKNDQLHSNNDDDDDLVNDNNQRQAAVPLGDILTDSNKESQINHLQAASQDDNNLVNSNKDPRNNHSQAGVAEEDILTNSNKKSQNGISTAEIQDVKPIVPLYRTDSANNNEIAALLDEESVEIVDDDMIIIVGSKGFGKPLGTTIAGLVKIENDQISGDIPFMNTVNKYA